MKRPKLLFAASEQNADLFYATGFRAPDAFAFLECAERTFVLLNDLEIDRGRSEARVDEVVSASDIEAGQRGKHRRPPYAKILAAFLRAHGVKRVSVPADFPFGLARDLKKLGLRIRPVSGAFFPQREIKTVGEIRNLTAAARIAEAGMARAFEVLAAARPRKDRKLIWSRRVLTSELLRSEIESAVLRAGGEARGDTIVACGEEACDPHARGSGALRANALIILDIFPRSRSGYFGDITRTVVRGTASEAQRKLWQTCLEGQSRALKACRPGTKGEKLQNAVKKFFAEEGYPTEPSDGRWRGFFHGLGHGLGLEVHESPRLGGTTLTPGQVVTIEPGIYWPGIGGVRHEDVVVITEKSHRTLTRHPKPLEI